MKEPGNKNHVSYIIQKLEKEKYKELYEEKLKKFDNKICCICLKELKTNEDIYFMIGCDCNIFYCEDDYSKKIYDETTHINCEICKKVSSSFVMIKIFLKVKNDYCKAYEKIKTDELIKLFGKKRISKIFEIEEINNNMYIFHKTLKKFLNLPKAKAKESFDLYLYYISGFKENERNNLIIKQIKKLIEIIN